ncbi:type II toxin-antitoxin system Phd/YefM family antitoxin [Jiangella gansuensis]|uniref:type II toxin-antitoxin system Phd/YefM family antitoxin n=1 Tax=Jiangella gansuensis TaxID=281473 RepID=UPI0004B4658C|nr:type II toxin-antitoxin system prevent-host-death family antitoxin [Jiangella gansuensis]
MSHNFVVPFVMVAVSIRELSHETSRVLRRVKAGETVEITERGRVIGRIVPARDSDDTRARLTAQGRLEVATGDRRALLATLERRSASEPVDAENAGSAVLRAMRDDERY